MRRTDWIRCPVCGNKTRIQIRDDTILIHFPLFCPKCKQITLIDVKDQNMIIVTEPDAKTQSR
ncbi:cysteine-rich KTR domain-containing protein [Caproicibacter fermentans]|uniref:Cysteine-rich KTR domain-containing protein n=1 Tax=Caproicibacter fermentans TaxID=2576756 RepID=A0A7G8T861_9FIRM|nr:cysteine-rich KTR domain-containing protein [Caproicibacter fermentans]QNK39802.1 cysteine-rich KTR domain-containing protein [Caproicibacter fermentans]